MEIVNLLLSHGANVDHQNNEGMNALMIASLKGSDGLVEILLACGSLVNNHSSLHSTALMLACTNGHENIVKMLVAANADVSLRDNLNRTAAERARVASHRAIFEFLSVLEPVVTAGGSDKKPGEGVFKRPSAGVTIRRADPFEAISKKFPLSVQRGKGLFL